MAIGITGKFKPDGDFPLIEAVDVEMPDGKRLSEFDVAAVVDACIDTKFVPISAADYAALVEAGTVDESKYYMIVG